MSSKPTLFTLLAAAIASVSITSANAKQAVRNAPVVHTQAVSAQAIERLIGVLDKAAKHPAAQIAGLILRGATAVKVYKLSKEVKGLKADVAALDIAVHATLSEITALVARIDAGETLTAQEIAAANTRIDVHALKIASVEAEIEVLKVRMAKIEAEQRETDRIARAQEQRGTRQSKEKFKYYDRGTGRHFDTRDRDDARGVIDVRAGQN